MPQTRRRRCGRSSGDSIWPPQSHRTGGSSSQTAPPPAPSSVNWDDDLDDFMLPKPWAPRPDVSPPVHESSTINVAEPPKLARLKCAGHHHKGNISSNALQTEQFWVCRVTSRYNHRFSDRTSIPRTKASPEILQPQFYNAGIVKITNQFKRLLQNQLK